MSQVERPDNHRAQEDAAMEPSLPPLPRVHQIRDLAQLKALADPLRIRIIEAIVEEPRTTKQVAKMLGEKPTKLYHHVDTLEKHGLIKLVATRPNRGTLEKYYRPVARLFRPDPALFSSEGLPQQEWVSLGADLLSGTVEELRNLDHRTLGGRKPLIVQARVAASQEELDTLGEQIRQVIDTFAEKRLALGEDRRPDDVDYRLALALYPIES